VNGFLSKQYSTLVVNVSRNCHRTVLGLFLPRHNNRVSWTTAELIVAWLDVTHAVAVDPVVSNVWPLFGPEAGGTLLTVTGSKLWQPDIVFISSHSDNVITLSTNTTRYYTASRTSKRCV